MPLCCEVVEDQLLEALMQRAKEQANQSMQAAGLEKFLEACESTTRKGQESAIASFGRALACKCGEQPDRWVKGVAKRQKT